MIEVVAENDGYMLPIVKENTEVMAGDIIGLLVINKDEIIFYTSIRELAEKISFYKVNHKQRRKIARKGQIKYFKLFNEKRITKYIIENSFNKKISLF